MATTIPVLDVERSGEEAVTYADGAAEMTLPANDGLVIVEIYNPTAGSLTATFATTATLGGMTLSDQAVTVPAGKTYMAGPWPPAVFNDDRGNVSVAADAGLQLRGYRI